MGRPSSTPRTGADLLRLLEAEFRKGGITEAHLVADDGHLDGLCEIGGAGRIYVDPAPNIVETLLHELTHRRFPTWTEKRVSDTAYRLVSRMSSAEIRRWYRRYRRAAGKAARPIQVDA